MMTSHFTWPMLCNRSSVRVPPEVVYTGHTSGRISRRNSIDTFGQTLRLGQMSIFCGGASGAITRYRLSQQHE